MRYASLFSGIEAATIAWEPLGWEAVLFSEHDPSQSKIQFPKELLAYHYPEVPNTGDVTEVDWDEYRGKAEIVVGGSPCQSFSVAGKRLGMDDPRGNLALHYLRAVDAIQPTWFVFENVPGLLSSDGGRDFEIFLGEVARIGYGFAYRLLDAQYFGVPQRRRRLFVIGHSGGDWRSAASVLFERESLQGYSSPRQKEGEETPGYFGGGTPIGSNERRRIVGDGVITGAIDTEVAEAPRQGHLIVDRPVAFEQNQRCEVRDLDDKATSLKAQPGTNQQTFIYDARGNEGEKVANTLTGDHQSRVSDYTAIAVEEETTFWDGSDKTSTLTSSSRTQRMPDKDNFMGVVETQSQDTFNAAGNGRWAKSQDKSATLAARDEKDSRVFVTEPLHDPAPPLDANYQKGSGERAGIERQVIGEVIGFSHTQGLDPQASTEAFPTLRAEGQGHAIGFDWKNTGQTHFSKEKTGAPLTAEGGLAVGIDLLNQEETGDVHPPLRTAGGHGAPAVGIISKGNGEAFETEKHMALGTGGGQAGQGYPAIRQHMAVRRLTPLECERLQGFPDHYTKIPYRGKDADKCPDGPRYKALGNSMAVPVMRWLADGIQSVDDLLNEMGERKEGVSVIQRSIFDF